MGEIYSFRLIGKGCVQLAPPVCSLGAGNVAQGNVPAMYENGNFFVLDVRLELGGGRDQEVYILGR